MLPANQLHTKAILAHVAKYIDLNDDEKSHFAAALHYIEVKKGSFLLEAGQLCNRQFFIVKGCVRPNFLAK